MARLVSDNKTAVVYNTRAKRFIDIRGMTDFEALMSGCSPLIHRKVENQLASEGLLAEPQANLF